LTEWIIGFGWPAAPANQTQISLFRRWRRESGRGFQKAIDYVKTSAMVLWLEALFLTLVYNN
jgi:hypothetical protein